METIMMSESLPRQLTKAERKKRLDAERQIPDAVVASIENSIRSGLWKRYEDDVSKMRKSRFEWITGFCEHLPLGDCCCHGEHTAVWLVSTAGRVLSISGLRMKTYSGG